jgi:glycosyltransferase involved in cell wall biosynthesis
MNTYLVLLSPENPFGQQRTGITGFYLRLIKEIKQLITINSNNTQIIVVVPEDIELSSEQFIEKGVQLCLLPGDNFEPSLTTILHGLDRVGNKVILESPELHGIYDASIQFQFGILRRVVYLHCPQILLDCLRWKPKPLSKKLRFFIGSLIQGKYDLVPFGLPRRSVDREKRVAMLADLVYSPSNKMKVWAKEKWNLKKNIQVVIPPIQSIFQFIPGNQEIEEKSGDYQERHQLRIGYFGRPEYNKGLRIFCDAAAECGRSDIDFVVIGSTQYSKVEKFESINFLGFLDGEQLKEEILECDLLVFPSSFESFGYAILEAIQLGVAVMVSEEIGILDWINISDEFTIRARRDCLIAAFNSVSKENTAFEREKQQISLRNLLESSMQSCVTNYAQVLSDLIQP